MTQAMQNDDTIRVLLIDDDEAAMLLASAILEQIPSSSFHLDWVSTFDQGRESMAKREHDVYLIDYMIGDHSGIELVRHARAELHRAPMILFDRQGPVRRGRGRHGSRGLGLPLKGQRECGHAGALHSLLAGAGTR